MHAICRTPKATQNDIRVRLKGMCDLSKVDKNFVLNWVNMTTSPWDFVKLWYQGERNTSIIYIGSGKWEISYSEYWAWELKYFQNLRNNIFIVTA